MAISLTLCIHTAFLITLIALTYPNLCTSQPRLTLKANTHNNLQSKSTPASSFGNMLTEKTVEVISRVVPVAKPAAFLANVSIGNPPVPQLLLIDTSSDLTWIQCLPCRCYPRTIPHFHPLRSSTYRNTSCQSAPQAVIPQIFRDEKNNNSCRYSLPDRDHSTTGGVLAEERFTFQTSNNSVIFESDIVFGCRQDNSGFNQYSGVLGLGPGNYSIVTRNFGSKFSYCFGSLTNQTYPHNILILGDGAKTNGDSTPLHIVQNRYYLDLQAISFGEKLLDIDPKVFKIYGNKGGTVIDTGSPSSILPREAYETLFGEIDFVLGEVVTRVKDWEEYTNPCYKGNMKLDLYGFPVVTFHFSGGAELALDVEGLFMNSESGRNFCLAINMNSEDDMSVIGVIAQQNYNVGYDLRNMKVYFQKTDCELLDS